MMSALPEEGAAHDTTASPSRSITVTSVGAPGAMICASTLVTPAVESPMRLTATTAMVYVVPGESPVTTQLVSTEVEQVAPPGSAVTRDCVIAAPPSDEGVLQHTATPPAPDVAVTCVGAGGALMCAAATTVTLCWTCVSARMFASPA